MFTTGRTLIFVETKRSADRLEYELYKQNHSVMSIHGDRSQEEREHALHNFKTSESMVRLPL